MISTPVVFGGYYFALYHIDYTTVRVNIFQILCVKINFEKKVKCSISQLKCLFLGNQKKSTLFQIYSKTGRAYNQVNALCLFLTKETQLKIFFRALYCYVGSVLLQGANINTICIDHKKWALRCIVSY